MDTASLYETDILERAEQPAATLRRVAVQRTGLPNHLDLDHVAEELPRVAHVVLDDLLDADFDLLKAAAAIRERQVAAA